METEPTGAKPRISAMGIWEYSQVNQQNVTKYLTLIYTKQWGYISFSYDMTTVVSPQVQQKHEDIL